MIDNDDDDIILSIQEELATELPTLSQVKESLRKELEDPKIALFCNICQLSLSEWDNFNTHSAMFKIPEQITPAIISKKKRKVHARRSYHYKIGQYETLHTTLIS